MWQNTALRGRSAALAGQESRIVPCRLARYASRRLRENVFDPTRTLITPARVNQAYAVSISRSGYEVHVRTVQCRISVYSGSPIRSLIGRDLRHRLSSCAALLDTF